MSSNDFEKFARSLLGGPPVNDFLECENAHVFEVTVASLATPVEWMRFCPVCNNEQIFVADRECSSGLVGRCSNCGDERIAPFTRTTSEVA